VVPSINQFGNQSITMSAIQQQVEQASGHYSSSFTQGHLALPPAKKYLVLTCMDARINPADAFGISLGDAHVIRNVSPLS
jgi:carbonic anhydrase